MGGPPDDIFCSHLHSATPMSDVEIVFCYLATLPSRPVCSLSQPKALGL
ncbi:hypothetical protein CGRA01v4_13380 [Colletotrichum graminicola]|nr:hypothetical protein CGRA01v4_13380 [Colletotrichum graminicola]